MIEPHYEIGARYWWSEGKTKFSINSSKFDPTLGSPTSTLTYDNVQANTAEFVFRARTEGNWFAKGFVGGGPLGGGSLDDRDFFTGQVLVVRHLEQPRRQRFRLRHPRCRQALYPCGRPDQGHVRSLHGIQSLAGADRSLGRALQA